MRPMVFTYPTTVVAPQMAHLMEKGSAVFFLRSVPIKGDFDTDTASVSPIELAELPSGVVQNELDGRKAISKN